MMKLLAGVQRNTHARAMSAGRPTRSDGCWLWSASDRGSSGLAIHPGLIELTVMPSGDCGRLALPGPCGADVDYPSAIGVGKGKRLTVYREFTRYLKGRKHIHRHASHEPLRRVFIQRNEIHHGGAVHNNVDVPATVKYTVKADVKRIHVGDVNLMEACPAFICETVSPFLVYVKKIHRHSLSAERPHDLAAYKPRSTGYNSSQSARKRLPADIDGGATA